MIGPSDTAEVRRNNLALVLQAIAAREVVSRTTIRAVTGLVSTSVSTLVDDLLTRGLVVDDGASKPKGPGRPRRQVRLNPGRVVTTTVHLSHLELIGELRDFTGELLWQRRVEPVIRRGVAGDLVEAIAVLLDEADVVVATLPDAWAHPPVLAIPAPIIDGRAVASASISGIKPFDLVEALSLRRPGDPAPVVVNVGRLAVYGEYAALPLQERPQSMAYFATGTQSIMGGLVVDGATYLGSHSLAGENGHIVVDLQGERCICGAHGCLETYLGLAYLFPRAGLGSYGDRKNVDEAMDALIALLEDDDDQATAAVRQAGVALASAIGTVSSLLDVELVVLGGAIARLSPWLLPPVEEFLAARTAVTPGAVLELRTATFGREAPRIGGWRLARQAVLDDPTHVPVLTTTHSRNAG